MCVGGWVGVGVFVYAVGRFLFGSIYSPLASGLTVLSSHVTKSKRVTSFFTARSEYPPK